MSKANPKFAVGTQHSTTNYGSFEVIQYTTAEEVSVRFLATGYITQTTTRQINREAVKDKLVPRICGVGYIGDGKYTSGAKHNPTAAYVRWRGIIARCYNKELKGYAQYGAMGVTVHKDWHNFQNFAEFYYSECAALGIDPENNEYQVDKDELSGSDKIYSADTCQLIHRQLNAEIATAKKYWFNDPSGQHVLVYNLGKFCEENGLTATSMRRVISGRYGQHKGWTKG